METEKVKEALEIQSDNKSSEITKDETDNALAIKRPYPEVKEDKDEPADKREKKEVVNKEKDMEVEEGSESNSAPDKTRENKKESNLKETKEDELSNGAKDQVLTNGSSGPASELAEDGINDTEMKEDSNDVEMKDVESLDDVEIDKAIEKVQGKKDKSIIDETETPTPSEEGSEDDKNEDDYEPEENQDDEDEADETKDDEDEEEEDDEEEEGDDDDGCSTPTRRSSKRKPKKFYDRPRGYAGKFLPQKKPEIAALLDENARMDMDEDSQGSSISKKKERKYRCEVINPESTEAFTAEKVVEYVWPLEGNGEHYFLQEQISQYLGIMSFKRKYPDLRRRAIEMLERDYLQEKGYVSVMACDLGLTAVRSEDVLDVMCNDFPSKFEALSTLMREKQEKEIREKGKVDYSLANIDKSKMQEYARKAAEQAARWNSNLNKERREERRYSFDLSSFTLHMNTGRRKILPAEYTKMGCYPVSVLPGQYTDSYRMYSPAALNTLPLGTVTADPMKDDLGSDGEESATEEEVKPVPIFSEMPWIYSKGANTPNKENVTENGSGGRKDFDINFKIQVAEYALQHTNAQSERKFQTSEANVRRWKQQLNALKEKAAASGITSTSTSSSSGPTCKHCAGNRQENKNGRPEPMLSCATCKCYTHVTCVDLTTVMIPKLESYKWQCIDCKTCMQCNDPDDAEKMIFCDMCDRGYHIYCVGLKRVPNGRWHCKECAICSSCKSRTPQGDEHIKNAEWQHEFKKDHNKQLRYAATLCIPCDRFWKRRQFCYICTRVYKSIPEDNMVRCANCPKYIHKDGCSTTFENEIFCNICYKSRNSSALNHSRIIAAAKKKMQRSY